MSHPDDQYMHEVPIGEVPEVTRRILARLNNALAARPKEISEALYVDYRAGDRVMLRLLTDAVGIQKKTGGVEHRLTIEQDGTTHKVKRFFMTAWKTAEQVAKEKEAAAAVPGYDANGSPV